MFQRSTWVHEELIALTAERLQNAGAEGADFWANVVRGKCVFRLR